VSTVNGQRKIVLEWKKSTGQKRGHHNTEKFTIPGNSHIEVRIDRRGKRWLPIKLRSSKCTIKLKDPETGELQENVSPDFKGKLSTHGNRNFSIIIHKRGTYYLYVRWGSLITELEIRVIDPPE
jgi:hypothetical protein